MMLFDVCFSVCLSVCLSVCRVHREYSWSPQLLEARRAGRRRRKACMGWSWATACGVQGRGHIVRPRAQLVKCVNGRYCLLLLRYFLAPDLHKRGALFDTSVGPS